MGAQPDKDKGTGAGYTIIYKVVYPDPRQESRRSTVLFRSEHAAESFQRRRKGTLTAEPVTISEFQVLLSANKFEY